MYAAEQWAGGCIAPLNKNWGGGAWCQKTLLRMYLTIPVTSATSEPTFSALGRLKKLPSKKQVEARLPGQLPNFCHKLITDTLDTVKIACAKEQCKKHFENIWIGVCIWLSGRSPPPTFQNTLPHLEYPLVFHTSIQQSHNNPKLLFNNKWSVIIHYILMVTLAHCTNLFLRKKMKERNK